MGKCYPLHETTTNIPAPKLPYYPGQKTTSFKTRLENQALELYSLIIEGFYYKMLHINWKIHANR